MQIKNILLIFLVLIIQTKTQFVDQVTSTWNEAKICQPDCLLVEWWAEMVNNLYLVIKLNKDPMKNHFHERPP